ncbi:unnamed protein product [Symbiodinium natans]|uniref:Uncharacterized protein n=1 Tax=Symbiodinium natans TaxID=878477 RepID=A0A812V1Q9_9DINO|nr:unnamed protein product [Symbiodinium natans]
MKTSRRKTSSESYAVRLAELYQQASQDIVSLASRLAQHNGLRQFSATFSNRAPPLELRMLLPELEASIEQKLQSVKRLCNEIAEMQFDDQSRMAELQQSVCCYLRSGIGDASDTFAEQRSHLRALQAAAPLTSPMTMPVPAMKRPSYASPRGHFESFSTASTQSSPNMRGALKDLRNICGIGKGSTKLKLRPELRCDDWDDDGEAIWMPTHKRKVGVSGSLSYHLVGPPSVSWSCRGPKLNLFPPPNGPSLGPLRHGAPTNSFWTRQSLPLCHFDELGQPQNLRGRSKT